MTQEEKELLIKDLCGRLLYGVFVEYDYGDGVKRATKFHGNYLYLMMIGELQWKDFKPYLRSMSSMTKEEREDFWWNVLDMDWKEDLDHDDDDELETVPFPFAENGCGFYLDNYYLKDTFAVIDWLNKHHFDYRGLIEKGLALEAPKDMYK